MSLLRDRTATGIFWSFIQRVGARGVSFLAIIILARILSPEEFGLIGMLTIFIQVSLSLVNAGFRQALIRKKTPNQVDYSSVFFLNIFTSLCLYLLIFFTAPFIAEFYNQPPLIHLCRVLSLLFVINAFSYVQETILTKEMRFKKLTIIQIPSTILGAVFSIVAAYMGAGVWSIVILQLTTRLAFAIHIWLCSAWKPLSTFSFYTVKQLFPFGGRLMLSSIINTVYNNAHLVVIGKFFPLSSVGYYQNANNLVQYPATTFASAIDSVTFSAFAIVQDNNEKLKSGYKTAVRLMLFLIAPAFIITAVLATPLFTLIFTEKWAMAVPYFRWLAITGILYPLTTYSKNMMNVKGHSALSLKVTTTEKIIISLGIIFSVPYGIRALLISQAVSSLLAYFINAFFLGKLINYRIREQIADLYLIAAINICVGALVAGIDISLTNMPDLIRLIIGYSIGFVVYLAIGRHLKLEPYLEVVSLLGRIYPSKRTWNSGSDQN